MSFKSAEKVYQYMADVTEAVGKTYKGHLAQLFTEIQQSYAQLFFYSHYLLEMVQKLFPAYTHLLEFQEWHVRANAKLRADF